MMAQQEYEQEKIKCWEEFKNAAFNGDISYSTCSALDFAFDRAYALGKQEMDAEETVISGWVARDENNSLYLYEKRPVRDHNEWIEETVIYLDDDLFPDLTWKSDPIEVELTIKRKK